MVYSDIYTTGEFTRGPDNPSIEIGIGIEIDLSSSLVLAKRERAPTIVLTFKRARKVD